ncbi:MAG: hypothetical protein Q9209_007744 [Squamulea sp. 1 TL-2023]
MTPSRPRRLKDDERPSSLLWFLAGGTGKPPTRAQLREWKRRDREEKARKGWNPDGNDLWRELWRVVGWRFKKGKGEKEAKKEENGEQEAEREVSAETEPAEEESSEEETEAADAEREEEGEMAAGGQAGNATGMRT